MLPLSLRRKSAPASANVKNGTSPGRTHSKTASLSSCKSLSSLFNFAQRDRFPIGPETLEEMHGNDDAQTCAPEIKNPDQNTKLSTSSEDAGLVNQLPMSRKVRRNSSPLSLIPQKPRSASQTRTGSMSKTFLDTIAAKMKTATQFFHKDSNHDGEKRASRSYHELGSSPSRSLSPKKSVRFRSADSTIPLERKSSPIDIPSRNPPILPAINLQTGLTAGEFGTLSTEFGVTARPPNTPILKGREAALPPLLPFPALDTDEQLRRNCVCPERLPIEQDIQREDPFDDKAAIEELSNATESSEHLNNQLSSLSFPAEIPVGETPLCETVCQPIIEPSSAGMLSDDPGYVSDKSNNFGPDPFLNSPDDTALKCCPTNESNGTWRSSISTSDKVFCKASREGNCATNGKWGYRQALEDDLGCPSNSDANDADSECSDTSCSVQRLKKDLKVMPTHEDIRRKFRTKSVPVPTTPPKPAQVALWRRKTFAVNSTDSSSSHSTTSSSCAFVDGIYRCKHRGHALESCESVDKDNKTENPNVDPEKHVVQHPGLVMENFSPEQPNLIPEAFVSPLSLKATVSSVSPPRSRRPFRFSNRTDEKQELLVVGNTTFSWQAHQKENDSTMERSDVAGTPSPVSIPLPLSVAVQNRLSSVLGENALKSHDAKFTTPLKSTESSERKRSVLSQLDHADGPQVPGVLHTNDSFQTSERILSSGSGQETSDSSHRFGNYDLSPNPDNDGETSMSPASGAIGPKKQNDASNSKNTPAYTSNLWRANMFGNTTEEVRSSKPIPITWVSPRSNEVFRQVSTGTESIFTSSTEALCDSGDEQSVKGIV